VALDSEDHVAQAGLLTEMGFVHELYVEQTVDLVYAEAQIYASVVEMHLDLLAHRFKQVEEVLDVGSIAEMAEDVTNLDATVDGVSAVEAVKEPSVAEVV